MNWKRGLGIGLIFFGIFIILTARAITGAVVGASQKYVLGWFGILVLVVGMLIVLAEGNLETRLKIQRRKEGIINAIEFFKRFDAKEKNVETRSLILDTSAVLRYSPEELDKELSKYKNIFVPDSVLDEIYTMAPGETFEKDPPNLPESEKYRKGLRRVVQQKCDDIEGYERFRKKAVEILERTEKPILRKELLPYLRGEKQFSDKDFFRLNKRTERLREIMAEEGIDLGVAKRFPQYVKEKLIEYLENECIVKKADTDVLAMGLSEARNRWHALIGEKDIDLRQAIEMVKGEYPKVGEHLDFVEPYEREYKTDLFKLRKYKEDRKKRLVAERKLRVLEPV